MEWNQTLTAITSKLKEDFYRQIRWVPETGNIPSETVSFLTEEEIRSLAKAWVDLVLWQKKQLN